MKNHIAFLLLATACALPAAAQTVYRCGDTYSQAPCTGSTTLKLDDARSASQRSESNQATKRDAKVADAMEKARLKEEAKPIKPLILPVKAEATGPDETKKKPAMTKPGKPQYFTAVSPKKPGEPKKKKKSEA